MAGSSIPERAASEAFEAWRNRPGRAMPNIVMEALLDAASRAYDSSEQDDPATPVVRTKRGGR